MAARLVLKFLHTMGAVGLMGSLACLLVLIALEPPAASLAGYAQARGAMAAIANWVFMPSLGLTLVAGLLSIAVYKPFHNAGWAWAKLATGILMFEGGLVSVQGPIVEEAERSARLLAAHATAAAPAAADAIASLPASEANIMWALLAVSTANVVLGVWRPRFTRSSSDAQSQTQDS
ncbi:MAG: hypothetical protein K2P80_15780 [Beijerinckiaceae bacterium]|nr:hypothetical protein [Beijerinckiaceae bacterium]